MAAFVTVLLCSNFIGAAKQATIDLPLLGADHVRRRRAVLPDLVHLRRHPHRGLRLRPRPARGLGGLRRARSFASFMAWVVVSLPPAGSDFMKSYQASLEGVFGSSWRIARGSMIAFWCGSFANSYVLAKMKIWTQGRWLWTRTIGSTIVGELIDSSLFYFIAFYGIWATGDIVKIAIAQYVLKTSWEIVMTPVTYRVVAFLKRAENEDYYDRQTDFNPFTLRS
mgnify:CR=1 FL=1